MAGDQLEIEDFLNCMKKDYQYRLMAAFSFRGIYGVIAAYESHTFGYFISFINNSF